MRTAATTEQLIARFAMKIDFQGPVPKHRPELGPCHVWKASCDRKGYGNIKHRGSRLAHRVAFFLTHGRWPTPFCLHACDNPPCVNPAHLFEGDNDENVADKVAKGRVAVQRGEHNGNSILKEPDVLAIRAAAAEGETIASIARRLGRSWTTIGDIVSRRRWTCV